jgi:hypothetical protein
MSQLRFLVFSVGITTMLATLQVHSSSVEVPAPRDKELITVFRTHRSAFEQLREMVTADMAQEAYFSEDRLTGNFSTARRDRYKALLAQIKPGLIVTVNYDKTVRFIFASGGERLAISPGWLKGIEFVPDGVQPSGVRQPDLSDSDTLPVGIYFRAIEPTWFVLYQRTD